MITLKNVSSSYGKTPVLKNVSLTLEEGKLTTLVGPNGCGKTTLLKTVIGLVSPTKGDVLLNEVSLSSLPANVRARHIAYLSQGKNTPEITVEKMVLHGRFPYLSYPRKYRKSDLEAARVAMEKMGISHLSDSPLASLSGGMRQKVYLAMALCQGAETVLMDEPTTYLDIREQMRFFELCKTLTSSDKTVLVVSHDLVSALKYSDAIAVMNEGEIRAFGTPQEVLESGVLSEVFGVDVLSFEKDGREEYYYRKGKEE